MNYCDGVGQKGLVDCDPENGQCEICYMADLEEENKKLKAENEALRKLVSDTAIELRKASSWICREVEAGTTSATYWAIRLREKADQIDAAMGQGEQP